MNDADRITTLIEILGEDNISRLKEKVTDLIIEAMSDDIQDYNRETYILNPEDIIDFVNECKEEAFKRIKEDVVNQMVCKIKAKL